VSGTAGHFLVVFGFTPLAARVPRSKYAPSRLRVTYVDGRGVLRLALEECTNRKFIVGEVSVDHHVDHHEHDAREVTVWLTVRGSGWSTSSSSPWPTWPAYSRCRRRRQRPVELTALSRRTACTPDRPALLPRGRQTVGGDQVREVVAAPAGQTTTSCSTVDRLPDAQPPSFSL
jgi:hypothetical protein